LQKIRREQVALEVVTGTDQYRLKLNEDHDRRKVALQSEKYEFIRINETSLSDTKRELQSRAKTLEEKDKTFDDRTLAAFRTNLVVKADQGSEALAVTSF
jgi:hypothetical protein